VSVKNTEWKLMTMRRNENAQRGFSLIELMVVVLIILIIAAGAIIQLPATLQNSQADSALREVVEQMRQAREYAIANRRYVQITFPIVVAGGTTYYEVQLTQMNTLTLGAGAVNNILSTVPIQAQMQFFVVPGYPDTPDAYGNAGPIVFGGVINGPVGGMLFQSDGELVNGTTYLPINGSIFMGVPLQTNTARAVTVMGTSGRVRGWKPTGPGWVQL
jgi:prepilin-type N-terminal cleavage/methylation domain-containing protein